jgi:glycine/D-amino acid oxidase-like deaminating enzyme
MSRKDHARGHVPKASPGAEPHPAPPAPKASPKGEALALTREPSSPAPKATPAQSPLSRRTLLTAATAAATTAACGPSTPAPPTAAFLGPDPAQAHRLRDGGWPQGPVSKDIRTQIAIVGGGVAGLAAAWRLHRAGLTDFQLLELEPELGGTARGGQLPRSAHPLGAHYLPSPHPECKALELLLTELGIIIGRDPQGRAEYRPSAIVAAPTERHQVGLLWREGLYPDDGETPEEAAQWARWRAHLQDLDRRRGSDGQRLFRLPVARSSAELRHLDTVSFAAYLDDLGLTSRRLRWAIDYACRDDYGCTTAQTSAFAGLHHFLARGLEDSREGHTLTWPEGNARLVRGLAERAELGERLSLATAVTAIDPDAGHLEICRLTTGERARMHADAILWAAPRFVLPRVLPPGRDPLPHGALGYAPWLVASVELRTRPRGVGAPLAWDNVPIVGAGLGYVLATHTEDRGHHGAGAVITYYEPMPGADAAELTAQRTRLLAGDLDHWQNHVRDALTAMHPDIARELVRIHITRWGHAMIRPVPGLLFGPALAQARAAIGRVQPCAADVAGLPLFEEAFYGGVLAAESALRRLGRDEPSIVET